MSCSPYTVMFDAIDWIREMCSDKSYGFLLLSTLPSQTRSIHVFIFTSPAKMNEATEVIIGGGKPDGLMAHVVFMPTDDALNVEIDWIKKNNEWLSEEIREMIQRSLPRGDYSLN